MKVSVRSLASSRNCASFHCLTGTLLDPEPRMRQRGSFIPNPPMKSASPIRFFACLLLGSALFAHADTGTEIVRIKTGVSAPLTDETGVVWRADTGFTDG